MKGLFGGLWFFALLGGFVTCLMIGWRLHSSHSYFYGFWYDHYEIGEHIKRFAPKNRFIKGLDELDKSEHVRLFNAISDAVHSHGDGLANIYFIYKDRKQQFLRSPEILHLQDVAHLIDIFNLVSLMVGFFSLILVSLLLWKKTYPDWRKQAGWLIGLLALILAGIVILGPEKVFYQLHTWAFPDHHQWFFYYEDSLMSTLMKAPDLFGGIAFAIAMSGGVLFLLFIYFLLYLQRIRSIKKSDN